MTYAEYEDLVRELSQFLETIPISDVVRPPTSHEAGWLRVKRTGPGTFALSVERKPGSAYVRRRSEAFIDIGIDADDPDVVDLSDEELDTLDLTMISEDPLRWAKTIADQCLTQWGETLEPENLRDLLLEVSDALDPQHQGEGWPDPIAWDGRPLIEQAQDLLVLVDARLRDEYGVPQERWRTLADRLQAAIEAAQ
jgi:hypothetical protein